jgi:nicotinamidase-related amidase
MKTFIRREEFMRPFALLAILMLCAAPVSAQQLPTSPSPVAVTLSPATTAVLVLDVAESPCKAIPKCVALVPRIASLLSAARQAGVLVVYSSADPSGITAPTAQPPFLPGITPAKGDPVFIGGAQDRFFGTLLDQALRKHGITTLVLAGWRENGSLLYTAVGATTRNYTVVVADDATSASQEYDVAIGRYQLLTQLNANPKNEPLHKDAVTLSRTDLISFR